MKLDYKEILKLKGKKLINTNPTSSEKGKVFVVTSATKTNVILNKGITIKTPLFYETKQADYELYNPKLVHDITNARVVTEDDEQVFYTDEFVDGSGYQCSDKVVQTVVDMFNEGKGLMEIDEYLLDEGECTQESREIIVESLYTLYYGKEN